jgi:hypothetical protein
MYPSLTSYKIYIDNMMFMFTHLELYTFKENIISMLTIKQCHFYQVEVHTHCTCTHKYTGTLSDFYISPMYKSFFQISLRLCAFTCFSTVLTTEGYNFVVSLTTMDLKIKLHTVQLLKWIIIIIHNFRNSYSMYTYTSQYFKDTLYQNL